MSWGEEAFEISPLMLPPRQNGFEPHELTFLEVGPTSAIFHYTSVCTAQGQIIYPGPASQKVLESASFVTNGH